MNHVFLALAALALLAVIVAQNWIVNPLRQMTISRGLEGPMHGWLDAVYVVLAVALVVSFRKHPLAEVFAVIGAVALVASGVCNTAWRWVDGLTGRVGGHEVWHLRFTYAVFAATAALQITLDRGALWDLSIVNALAPLSIWALSKRVDYAEKQGVLILCLWLIAWAV